MSSEDAAETAVNSEQQPDVQEEWDGMTVLQVSMDAVCREQRM